MARKKKESLFNDLDQEKYCLSFLRERGYVIFKAGHLDQAEEEEAVRKLRAVGYKVEHIRDSLIKIDPTKIRTVDDVAVYFHEMMSRYNPKRHNPNRLSDKDLRIVDHSVINSFISYAIVEGSSLTDAIEDMFLLIDVLFEKAQPWNIDIRGIGILSINNNKPFVMSLMREVKLKKDSRLEFEVEQLKADDEKNNYVNIIMESRRRMDLVGPAIKPINPKRKKIKGRSDGDKEKN